MIDAFENSRSNTAVAWPSSPAVMMSSLMDKRANAVLHITFSESRLLVKRLSYCGEGGVELQAVGVTEYLLVPHKNVHYLLVTRFHKFSLNVRVRLKNSETARKVATKRRAKRQLDIEPIKDSQSYSETSGNSASIDLSLIENSGLKIWYLHQYRKKYTRRCIHEINKSRHIHASL
nr:unnamed protein product [Callosobruchus chinensis]